MRDGRIRQRVIDLAADGKTPSVIAAACGTTRSHVTSIIIHHGQPVTTRKYQSLLFQSFPARRTTS